MIKIKKGHKTQLLVILGLCFLLSHSIVITLTFFAAYLNDYQVLVTINRFGEAAVESILVPLGLVWGLWSMKKIWDAEIIDEEEIV